ncbi:MAG: hypothetical protein H6933_19720 [Burkholderiaceae bacterium]|nr:hypothetical protein [Burkholderiaceae bacterium]
MPESAAPAPDAVYAKTALGQQEIQQRSLRLPLLTRRVLLLVDGRRPVHELAVLAGNADTSALLAELEGLGCIELMSAAAAPAASSAASAATAASSAPTASPETAAALAGLPPPPSRSAEQVDMARNFMINTINRMLEQNSRLTLVEKIFHSVDAAELREHYAAWEEAIGSSWMGRKRLDELKRKLFEVL